jgi:hypothetical protein
VASIVAIHRAGCSPQLNFISFINFTPTHVEGRRLTHVFWNAGQKARLLLLPNNIQQQPKAHTPPTIPKLSLSGGGEPFFAFRASRFALRNFVLLSLS